VRDILDLFTTPAFYAMVLQLATPLVFATLAALVSNRAGVLNIGIEGTMVVSALAAAIASTRFGSAAAGLAAAILAGILAGGFFALCAVRLRTHHILVGIATNILAAGLAVFVIYGITGNKSDYPAVAIASWSVPFLRDIPFLGEIFFENLHPLVALAAVAVAAVAFLFRRTVLGIRIVAVGKNETAAASVGIPTRRIKTVALLIAGGLAGLGGAYLSLGYMSGFNTGMVAGRGFIGIAAEAMGAGHPIGSALFAVLFGMVNAFSLTAQTFGSLSIPYELLNTLPYLTTTAGLVIYSIVRLRKARPRRPRKEKRP